MIKNLSYLFLLCFFITSCSNDDDSSGTPATVTNPLPVTQGSYWIYDVQTETISGRDSLYVDNETSINGNVYKNFKTQAFPFGFYSNALNNSSVRQLEDKLLLTAMLPVELADLPIEIDINDFVIFDGSASGGSILSETTSSFEQQIEGFDIQGTYTLSSLAGDNLITYTAPDGTAYNNVKSTVLKLNLTIVVTLPGVPFPFTILPSQDVLVSTHYYADGIGMVHSVSDVQYQLADTFGVEVPLPQSANEHQEEILANYFIQP